MSKRFLTYNTEDAEAGKVPVNIQGIIDPEKLPCYDSRDIRTATYTFDGNLEGKETGEYNNWVFVKVSDEFPDISSIEHYVCCEKSGDTPESLEDYIYEYNTGDFNQLCDNLYWLCEGSAVYASHDIEAGVTEEGFARTAFSKGLYLIASFRHDEVWYATQLDVTYIASGELKKLDHKFVPPSFFLVTFTEVDYVDDRPVLSSSATADEIIKAYSEGQFPIARFETMFYYPREILPDERYVDFYDIGSGAHIDMNGDEILFFGSES